MKRASWRTSARVVVALALAACGDSTRFAGPGGRTPDLSDARPLVPSSDVAGDLVRCVDPRRAPSSCTTALLPPIGSVGGPPAVSRILEHVVVSHDWMGARFEEILRRLPAELRRVLGAATAIVIDADVRPSFYWPLTGAIYVDPRHLWLTPEEEATLSDEPDYRSGFGAELRFVPFASYRVRGAPAFASAPTRSLEDRVPAVAALLFHEGAHANDFLPPDRRASLREDETFLDAVDRLEDERLSSRLAAEMPLASRLWRALARVLYFGEPSDAEQRRATGEEAGAEFAVDGANDPYAYSTEQEDLAMLFEEVMLKRHFDFDRRVGFADAPAEAGADCRDYRVAWGMIGRVAAPTVVTRARRAVELLLEDPLDAFFATLPAAETIAPGEDLCEEADEAPASALRWM